MTTSLAVERWLPRPGHEPATTNVELHFVDGQIEVRSGVGGTGKLALPAPVNAHDHGYGIRTLDIDCADDALEVWIPGLRLRPPTDPYLEALVAFGRVALSGCGATMHCHNSLNAGKLVEEADAVIRAARDVGIRLALSCPLLDCSPWVYGGTGELRRVLSDDEWKNLAEQVPSYLPISEQMAAVAEIAAHHVDDGVDVQFGPIGPQWCSDQLLEAIADASALSGRRIHMHLLESPRQRVWLDQRFPEGVVRHLDRIGFLSPRLAIAHGVQLRADEIELLAERGVSVVSNPSANLRLRSGVAPVGVFTGAGLKYALGLDGSGFDDGQDIWQEMRLFRLLHGGTAIDPATTGANVFDAVIANGAAVVNQLHGHDVVVVDYGALTRDALFDDLDETGILLGRMNGRNVTDLIVRGEPIVTDGRTTRFDFDAARAELVEQARSGRGDLEIERSRARALSDAVRRYYRKFYP